MKSSIDADAVVLSRHCIMMDSCRLNSVICVISEDVSFAATFSVFAFVYSLVFFSW